MGLLKFVALHVEDLERGWNISGSKDHAKEYYVKLILRSFLRTIIPA